MRSTRSRNVRPRAWQRIGRLLFAASLLFVAVPALAEPSAADKETARRHMAEGRAHRRSGDSKGALQSFLAADAIMHVPTTALEVARSEIELGRLIEARDRLLTVARGVPATNEPHAFSEARATAKTLSAEVEAKIPNITVAIEGASPGAAVTVTLDEVEVPAASLTNPHPVDPGHHVVAATAGGAPHEVSVDISEGEIKRLIVDLAGPGQGGQAASIDTTPSTDKVGKWRLASYVGFGVGGGGVLIGAITGAVAIADFSAAKRQGCVNNQCPPSSYPELDKAGTMATVSTVAFVIGGLGAGVGVASFFLDRRGASAAEHPAASLYVGPGSVGLKGTF